MKKTLKKPSEKKFKINISKPDGSTDNIEGSSIVVGVMTDNGNGRRIYTAIAGKTVELLEINANLGSEIVSGRKNVD